MFEQFSVQCDSSGEQYKNAVSINEKAPLMLVLKLYTHNRDF